jgi:hypothetical protein
MEAADDQPATTEERELWKIRQVRRVLGEKVPEADFFRDALERSRADARTGRLQRAGVFEQITPPTVRRDDDLVPVTSKPCLRQFAALASRPMATTLVSDTAWRLKKAACVQ